MFTKFLVALVVSLGLLVGGTTTTATAAPYTYGEQSYLDVMHAGGYYNEDGDDVMLDLGYTICTWIATGWTFYEVVEKVWDNTPSSYSWYDSGYMVGAAHDNLCPSSFLV